MKKRTFATAGASILIAASLGVVPGTGSAGAATPDNGCTLGAYYPYSGGIVRGYAQIYNCNGSHNIQVQTCLQQLVTGGWQNVVGSCATSQEVYSTFISATGKSYYPTCGRYYRSWGWAYVDGGTVTEVSNSYQGCS
jgi:hypothetical protein